MSSSLAKRYAALPPRRYRIFKPHRLQGELPDEWIRSKPGVNVDGNEFMEANGNSDDTTLLMRQSRLFHVRENAYNEAREAQLSLLDKLEKEKAIEAVPDKWKQAIDVLKRGSKQKAESEYNQLSRWKVRTEELKPDRDVFAYDYIWVMHALRAKTCLPEGYTQHFFPLPFVISGIKRLAQKLLLISNPPEEEEWYRNLCPWISITDHQVEGYPPCLTPSQVFQMFRHAGHQLALGVKADNPEVLLSSASIYGYIFERFAASPQYLAQYADHWSRHQLSSGGGRYFLNPKEVSLLVRSYRSFPAFKMQQAWWYSQPHRLRDETLEEGIYFYPVPSVRHTLQAGLPTLRDASSELAAGLLWGHFAEEEGLDITTDDVYSEFRTAVSEVDDEESNREAWERVSEELFGEESPLVRTADLTKMPPTFPNELYNETYRPILRYEIDHAQSNGVEVPDWYTRRRREIATGPHASLVPDLTATVSGETLDFSDFEDAEPEPEPEAEAKKAEEDEDDESLDGAKEVRDAFEDESLPLVERMRMARLQSAIKLSDEKKMKETMSARDYATHYEQLDKQYTNAPLAHQRREEKLRDIAENKVPHPVDRQ
eukprot:TRINITY_DN26784_c0_g1_i1.p1 TRINITY_DN26784_c0_g1~~TRINITY_DN26784_c0_g1_i1.p1  ORF type:complete len:600 (+),score=245.96 TRINITY_DN26784_c0_g1_i1:130-1929(+)